MKKIDVYNQNNTGKHTISGEAPLSCFTITRMKLLEAVSSVLWRRVMKIEIQRTPNRILVESININIFYYSRKIRQKMRIECTTPSALKWKRCSKRSQIFQAVQKIPRYAQYSGTLNIISKNPCWSNNLTLFQNSIPRSIWGWVRCSDHWSPFAVLITHSNWWN